MSSVSQINLCAEFAALMGAESSTTTPEGVCVATRTRRDLSVTILGRPTHSPVVFAMPSSFEDLDSSGNALDLGEFVFTENEVETFLNLISVAGIKVTAVHNHWQFEIPRLIYVHWEAIMNPLAFAAISGNAINVATGTTPMEDQVGPQLAPVRG